MRRFVFSLAAGLVLAGATARPAAADVKEYLDCMRFVTRWCDLAREDANNFLEAQAVEVGCALRYAACTTEIF